MKTLTAIILVVALSGCAGSGDRRGGAEEVLAKSAFGFACSLATGGLCAIPLVAYAMVKAEQRVAALDARQAPITIGGVGMALP